MDEILFDADEVYTPDIVLAEIARKYIREGVGPQIVDHRLNEIVDASNVVCIDARLAGLAAKCYFELETNAKKQKLNCPSLFDGVVLAAGRMLESKVLSGDQHFKGLPDIVWIE